ncbi:MAG: hypothetical protein K2L13_00885 [Opitutales bacterium]|nr:hypothetical protein [Opitutales bacterium]
MQNINTAVLEQELRAREAIRQYMLRRFNARVEYKSQKVKSKAESLKPLFTVGARNFWEECKKCFEDYADNATLESVRTFYDLEPDDSELDSSVVDKDDGIAGGVYWATQLDEFRRAYSDIENHYLRGLPTRKIITNRFNDLCRDIENECSTSEPQKVLPRLSLAYIPEMIDFRSTDVQALLPYLLTAYVHNFRKEHLFYRDTKKLHQLFDNAQVTALMAPDYRNRIEQLGKIFSLADNMDDFVPIQTNRPSPNIYPVDECGWRLSKTKLGTQYVRFESVLWDVFEEWCRIIPRCAKQTGFTDIEKNLNIPTCQYLVDYYISQKRHQEIE